MLNVHFTVLAILELALIQQCLFEPNQLAFPFTAPSSIFLRRFAPRLSSSTSKIRRRTSLVDSNNDELFTNLTQSNLRSVKTSVRRNPFFEFFQLPAHQSPTAQLPQNDLIHNLLPVLQSPSTIELLKNPHYHLNSQLNHRHRHFNNDPLTSRLNNRLDRLDNQLDHHLNNHHQNGYNNHQLHNHHQNSLHLHHQPILIQHPTSSIQPHYSFYLQPTHPHLVQQQHQQHHYKHPSQQVLNKYHPHLHLPIVNQSPFSLSSKVQQLKLKLKQQKSKLKQQHSKLDYHLNKLKSLSKSRSSHQTVQQQLSKSIKLDQSPLFATTISPLNANSLTATTISTPARAGYLEIGSTAHLNQFSLDTEGEDYLDSNNLENNANSNSPDNEPSEAQQPLDSNELNNKIIDVFNESSISNRTGSGNYVISNVLTSTVTSLIRNDLENLLKQIKPNFVNFNHQSNNDLKSKYAYDLIGSNSTASNFNVDMTQNVQVDFKERTAPDISAGLFSRALGSLTNYIPSAMKITRTSGCVGGTKCTFFVSCWISSGSLGSSCGPLSTCCITPSKQDIQPAFYGPVVNDPHCGRSATRISRIVGGMDASFGLYPWQAFVQVGGSRCGGALVGQKHVVTAGHCVARSQHNPSEIRVTLGDYILNSDIESLPHEVFTVAEVKLHPNFRFTPQADRYDVAILVLDRIVQYRNNIKPICLPQKDANYLGRVAYVAGWGALQAGSKLRPKVLQHVNVPVIDNNVCEIWHRKRGINIKIHDEMICAGYQTGNKDACQGDSGGPLMLNEFGVWYLIGIVSAGYSCAKQYQPGIYHRVSSSSDWVSASIYQNSN